MKELIEGFYSAFQNKDAEKMVAYYHDEVEFTDPAFGTLKGEHAKNMWRMLIERGSDLTLEFSNITADETNGTAHWEANYTFSQTGRKVLNKIDAEFTFKDGKIIKHIDSFDLHNWAKQAMGFKGVLLGGTGFFKKKLNSQTNHMLAKYEKSQMNG